VNAVPDLKELSAPDPDDWLSVEPEGRASDIILFALSLSLIIAFSFLNLYTLPLGTVSVQAVYENAGQIYGSDVEVYGIISHSNDIEFTLADENSTGKLEAVWLGAVSLPLNGSHIVATGQVIEGTSGPAMMCSSISVRTGPVTSYENPWTLPALRILSSILIWFTAMVLAAGVLALLNLHRRSQEAKHRVSALSEISTVAGGILTAVIVTLLLSEPSLSGSAGIFAYCAEAAFALLLLSSVSRRARRADIAEISNPVPVIAAIVTLLGLSLSFLNIQSAPEATLISEMAIHLQDSIIVTAVGASGLICLGAYLARRRFEMSVIEDSLEATRAGVS